jgi:hypothetical protein
MVVELRWDDGTVTQLGWAVFVDLIEESEFTAADMAAMRVRLEAGEAVTLGGGAAPLVTVRAVVS